MQVKIEKMVPEDHEWNEAAPAERKAKKKKDAYGEKYGTEAESGEEDVSEGHQVEDEE